MFPDEIIFGITLYDAFLCLGIISSVVVYDIYLSKREIPLKVKNFYLICGVFSIIFGLFGAELFQSVFNYIKSGVFVFGGLTFYGGIISGAVAFFTVVLIFGKLYFKENEHEKYFGEVLEVVPCCITVAHALGRIGCLTAGCCHGYETNSAHGVFMYVNENPSGGYYVPTQLYEAIFLICLFIVLSCLYFKNGKTNFAVYLIAYGVWRFIIEFVRGDERGAFITGLTPAQAISIIAVVIGLIIVFVKIVKIKKQTDC